MNCLVITCLVACREAADELVSVSLGGRLLHGLHGDVAEAVGDVLLHRPSKQHRLLAHQTDLQTTTWRNDLLFTIFEKNIHNQRWQKYTHILLK